jgi:CBS domain containing-hemolysin-like protein
MLFVFHKFLSYCGIVPLLRAFANFFARLTGSHSTSNTIIQKSQRHHIDAILKDTLDEGLLSTVQSDMINRIVSIPTINLRSVMIPINKTQMVPITSNKTFLIDRFSKVPFTRLLVYDRSKNNIVGFVEIYDCLSTNNDFNNLNDFLKPIRKIKANTPFTQAVKIMQQEKHKIALIIKASHRHKPLGIVTMKDLIEELLGELIEW